jgi:acyl-CoA synthetase (AMP-forming)/AMP-acid ligase II
MHPSPNWNFAGRLAGGLGENSVLIEAASAQTFRVAEIKEHIAGFAAGFLSNGLRPGDRLLISCSLNPSTALAYLGAMYAGCVPVMVDERTHAVSGEALVKKANAKAAWSPKPVPWDWAQKNAFPQMQGNFPPRPADSLEAFPRGENDLASLMPTSGSTGTPRLVMVSHGNLVANTEAIIQSQHLGSGERAMLIMPLSYCFGASILHTHLYAGGGVVFDSRFMFPDKVLQAINTYECTTFAGVPTVYNILLRRSNIKSIPMPSLRRFLQAGGALATESVQEMRGVARNSDFYVMYGQTEATSRISCLPANRLHDKLGSVGIPLENLTIRIVDAQGHKVPRGHTGEVQVIGPSVCGGYFGDAEATGRKLEQGWLKTGDLASQDEDGYLWIKGRTSDFIKIRGYRVSLADVEAKVGAVAGVCECAAAGVEHPEAGEALALFVVKDDAAEIAAPSLVESVRRALPTQWICASIRVVPDLPRTANGKIARSELHTFA